LSAIIQSSPILNQVHCPMALEESSVLKLY
jgi:hypothetical protein